MNSSSLDMRKNIIYIILAATAMLFSCQKPELTEQEVQPVQGVEVGNEATISFTALVPGNPDTKAMTETPTDLVTMHLVIFDGNGMYIETREAKKGSAKTHDGHNYETTFEVTLTVTDQPRIIHFIANCPVEQILYGHEASIIGNMYTTKANYVEEDRTVHETAYWARIEVPYILVEETAVGSGKYRPIPGILGSFQCVPMLRNYAQVIVKDSENTTEFEYLGFTLYNTIDLGTVAPYNNTTQKFQNFVNSATGKPYKYPNLAYQGHALAAAELNTSLEMVPNDGTDPDYDGYKWYNDTNPFYMYERKISVKTDEEEKWSESPPHVIIKGRYNGKINYYKVDLVYNVYEKDENGKDTDKVTDIVYYNILRNFRYQFTISEVVGEGYSTVPDAINGSTSNNLSGSSTTSKFTNISDKVGRIWVSYTDTTLVSNNTITLKYKYVPNISDNTAADYEEVHNELVTLEGIVGGEIIDTYQVAGSDVNDGGTWDGFREVTLTIKNPEDMTKEQAIMVRTDNANLTREVRYYLKNAYPLEVECTPKVEARIGAPVEVDIKLPVGLTEDMFPLDLDIEVYDMTLSPDASKNTLPVVTGPSTIDAKNGVVTFHFVKTFETKEEYDAITTVGTQKILKTYWYTNMAANESRVYVSNKYFTEASDNFVNAKSFVSLTLNGGQTVREGAGRTVSATLVLPESDNSYASRNIKFTLEGLSRDGSTEPFYITPTSRTVTINNLVTTDANSTLKITAEEDSYAEISASVGRRRSYFTTEGANLGFSKTSLGTAANETVNFSFTLSDYDPGMTVTVALDGLVPADDNLAPATATRAAQNYVFTPTGASCTLRLMTTEGAKTCSVQLFADEYYYDATDIETIEQADKNTIPAGKLITNIARNNGFASGGTIYLYTNSNYTGTSVGYSYTRSSYTSGRNTYSNGCATNTNEISLTGVKDSDTLYIRYVNGTRTYTGSFVLSDAKDNNGVTITLTQQ